MNKGILIGFPGSERAFPILPKTPEADEGECRVI